MLSRTRNDLSMLELGKCPSSHSNLRRWVMIKVPILIAVPFWRGDHTQAIELCKIMVGLQSAHAGQTCHVMLICRQDFKIDPNMVKIVALKFNVLTYQSQSPLRGWPQGPNGMFGSTMIHIANNFKEKYECVYWMEPDAIPLCPNWHWCLVQEWRRRHPQALIVGCRSTIDGSSQSDHITGCALYHPNIARVMPYLTTSSEVAWDYIHREKIIASGGSTKLIQNRYGQRNLPPGVIDEPGLVIIHGCKDASVTQAVRAKHRIS